MKNKLDVKYQFTKIARDLYNVYDSTNNEGAFLNTKDLCDTLVQKRGGAALTQDIYDMLDGAENGHTFGITESALTINKSASTNGIEPWKLAEVDGQEVFVSASTGCDVEDDDEDKLKKKASLNKPVHTYKVAIHTGTLAKTARAHDILKNAGYGDEDLYINPANPDTVVVTVKDDKSPSQVQKAMCDKMNGGYVTVDCDDIECCHDFCDCGCEPFDYPDMKEGEFVLIIPNNKPMFATSADSLRDYATANNFADFKVCAADGSAVYDSALKDAIKEIDEVMPKQQVNAEVGGNKVVLEDENTGEVFTEEQLAMDPNKNTRTLKTREVTTSAIEDMFKEAKTIDLSLADKNFLRAAFHYGGFEKVAYLSEDSFTIKAGEAVVTVENDKASFLPLAIFNDVALGEDSKEKEEAKSDSILG